MYEAKYTTVQSVRVGDKINAWTVDGVEYDLSTGQVLVHLRSKDGRGHTLFCQFFDAIHVRRPIRNTDSLDLPNQWEDYEREVHPDVL